MQRRLIAGAAMAVVLTLGLGHPVADAQSPEVAKVPEGSISLHYFRPDGAYDDWGVHFWETFEPVKDGKVTGAKSKSDMPIMDIAWTKPMKPTGKDGFGAYWQVKTNEFRNAKVNYIIHKGDAKDCTKDSNWFVVQGRQAFINSGDCTIYFTVEEAMKARK